MLQLKAFTETNFTKLFNFEAQVYVTAPDEVIVEYSLKGPSNHLHFPPSHEDGMARRDELWKTTCFEAFFSANQNTESPYLEINCSPAGDWNAYSFSSYRQGMTPHPKAEVKLIQVEPEPEAVLFRVRIQCPDLVKFRQMGITSVVEFSDGSKSYWSLSHPGPQADFHNKSGFTHPL
ncbi:MAG: DOMON-like domain-containing protein [Bdellovibrio sp.]|nr:DOMON-like domain-containing protein [Bdellovibrio sp.]